MAAHRRGADPMLAYLGISPVARRDPRVVDPAPDQDLTLLTEAELAQLETVLQVLERRMALVRAFVPFTGL